jgi:hypothetical protein
MRFIRPPLLRIFGLVGLAALAGCSSAADKAKQELAPVKGRILAGDKPLTGALITFHPDASKGNTVPVLPMGKVGATGEYELVSGENLGAAPGWYRVTLTRFGAPGGKAPPIPPRYTQRDQTNLSVEVVREPRPGQYDLRLTR